MINVTTKFDGFSDDEMRRAIEEAAKDKLRKNGLSHLRVRATKKFGNQYDISIEGGSEADRERAKKLFTD